MIGPFQVTPYLADHSAFDAYSFLIEADGQRLFYSGDLRGHGWKEWAFKSLLDQPPPSVDMMLLEGTTLGRDGQESEIREADLVPELSDKMEQTSGIILAAFSGQNVDRFVTFYKAALKAGRIFVADLYIAELLRAIDRESFPDPTSEALRVYLPYRTKLKIVREERFDLVEPYKARRIYAEELKRRAGDIVMSFRASMAEDLKRSDCLKNGRLIYSMWPGYLSRANVNLKEWCKENDVSFDIVHTSGHASPNDLLRLVSAIKPKALVPIHTLAPDKYSLLGAKVVEVPNDLWFPVV